MHFLQQRYISGEMVNSFHAGGILSPQLLQDSSHLKGAFTQPGANEISKSDGILEEIQKRLPTVTYPQSSFKIKHLNKWFMKIALMPFWTLSRKHSLLCISVMNIYSNRVKM